MRIYSFSFYLRKDHLKEMDKAAGFEPRNLPLQPNLFEKNKVI